LIGISNALGRSLDWLAFGRGTTVGAAPGFVLIPHFDVQAGAGPGRLSVREPSTPYDEPAGGEVIAFREDWLRKKGINPHTAHVLTAVGDSMEPTIRDGDLLLVDRAIDRVRDLGLYVVTWGGFVMVKRVELRRDGTLVLKSDNRQYAEVLVGPDEIESLAVEGRVRWIARTT
jgi:phage repressor protein C with HTH and peptisase S24 domain